jgi:copper homeostasis protein (lipoprotein)
MKKSIRLLVVIAIFTSLGCRSQQQASTLNYWDGRDVNVIDDVFQAMLPCADCEKIDFRLSLKPDMTWQSYTLYMGKSSKVFEENGHYNVTEDGILVLGKSEEGIKRFRIIPRGLLMLDMEGKEIEGKLADKYVLTPVKAGSKAYYKAK